MVVPGGSETLAPIVERLGREDALDQAIVGLDGQAEVAS